MDLQTAMGRKEIKWSLKTSDPREAARLINFESAKADAIFEEERRKLKAAPNAAAVKTTPLRILSEQHAQELARSWFVRLEKEEQEWWTRKGRTLEKDAADDVLEELHFLKAAFTGEAPNAVPPEHREDGSGDVRQFLAKNSLTLAEDSPAFWQLCGLFREAKIESLRRGIDRMEGKPIRAYDPLFSEVFAHSVVRPKSAAMTVRELGEKFLTEQERGKAAPKTLFAYTVYIRFLLDVLGDETPIDQISRPDVERLCGMLEKLPSNATKRYPKMTAQEAIEAADAKRDPKRLSANSRRNYFFSMSAVFRYAVETRAATENPFNDLWLKKRFQTEDTQGVPFSDGELKKLFSAPLYRGCQDDEWGYAKPGSNIVRRGRFWVPLIGLFHGFRVNEICQMHTQDMKQLEGELVFEVRASLDDGTKAPDKRTKNKASVRTVPVHPELLKMGFAAFVEARRADSASHRLFPELNGAKKSGSYGDVFSKFFRRFLTHAIGYETDASFHSFRHTWRDALSRAGVGEEWVKKLGGWAREGQHAKYGAAKHIQELKGEIAKVAYPALDFTALYVP